jgi:hypothetical protein
VALLQVAALLGACAKDACAGRCVVVVVVME